MNIEEIDELRVDGSFKGLPDTLPPTPIADIPSHGWNLLRGDVSYPVAVINERLLRQNSRWMRDFVQKAGVSICPHGKTTMAPQLFELQLSDGAWGITAASVTQVVLYRKFGVRRIILANQLLERGALAYICQQMRDDPEFDFYCLVDSNANLKKIIDHLKTDSPDRPFQLLLEVGIKGGRTGVRDVQSALALARSVNEAEPLVSLRGVEAFEGIFEVTRESGRAQVDRLIDTMEKVAVESDRMGLFGPGEVILSAGGSAHFDEVVRRCKAMAIAGPRRIVIRSGCYLTHDHDFYARAYDVIKSRSRAITEVAGELAPALEVWAQVQSVPERGLAIVALGKRDISHDINLPKLCRVYRRHSGASVTDAGDLGEVKALNDHHAFVSLADDVELSVGDLVSFGVSHPCTTFDKWQIVLLVNDDYRVVGAVKTYF